MIGNYASVLSRSSAVMPVDYTDVNNNEIFIRELNYVLSAFDSCDDENNFCDVTLILGGFPVAMLMCKKVKGITSYLATCKDGQMAKFFNEFLEKLIVKFEISE